jgi:hypothetical protein
MRPRERLASWRAEIESELAEQRKQVAALEAEHAQAVAAARCAASEHRELQEALRAVTEAPRSWRPDGRRQPGESPAVPILLRAQELKSARDAAQGEQLRVLGQLEAARRKVAEWEHGLKQLDLLLAPAAVEEAA